MIQMYLKNQPPNDCFKLERIAEKGWRIQYDISCSTCVINRPFEHFFFQNRSSKDRIVVALGTFLFIFSRGQNRFILSAILIWL